MRRGFWQKLFLDFPMEVRDVSGRFYMGGCQQRLSN